MARTGEAFAETRKARGYSQAELARAVHLHVNTVSNIERGILEPSILALGLLCLELGCERLVIDDSGLIPLLGAPDLVGRFSAGQAGPEPVMAALHGAHIRTQRLAAGLSIETLARASGIHPNTLRNFERGLVAPAVLGVCRVYRNLGLSYVDSSGGPSVLVKAR